MGSVVMGGLIASFGGFSDLGNCGREVTAIQAQSPLFEYECKTALKSMAFINFL
jgi:hypothetical protein